MWTTDNELLALFTKKGDVEALEELIRRHSPMVMAVCKSMLWRHDDAEDAYQNVFLVLAQKAPHLLKHNSIGGWLHEVATRTSLKLRRSSYREREELVDVESNCDEPWQLIAEAHENETLHREILQLPKKYREVIVICYLQGKSRADAARILDCSVASVKAALVRGRKLLRHRLIKHGIAVSIALCNLTRNVQVHASSSISPLHGEGVSDHLIDSTVQACVDLAKSGPEIGAPLEFKLISKGSLMNHGLSVFATTCAASFLLIGMIVSTTLGGKDETLSKTVILPSARTVDVSSVIATHPVFESKVSEASKTSQQTPTIQEQESTNSISKTKASGVRRLEIVISALDRELGLSDAQVKKLRVAAKGIVAKQIERIRELSKSTGIDWEANRNLDFFNSSYLKPEESELWKSTIRKLLSSEQLSRHQRVSDSRDTKMRRLAVANFVNKVDRKLLLSEKQRTEITQLLDRHIGKKLQEIEYRGGQDNLVDFGRFNPRAVKANDKLKKAFGEDPNKPRPINKSLLETILEKSQMAEWNHSIAPEIQELRNMRFVDGGMLSVMKELGILGGVAPRPAGGK